MPDDVPQVPLTPNPPIPSADGVPAKDGVHQLQYLPSLSPETVAYKNPIMWIVVLFILSIIVIIVICGNFVKDSSLFATLPATYITSAVEFFTTAIIAVGGDKITRKLIYMAASNKDGVNSNIPQ